MARNNNMFLFITLLILIVQQTLMIEQFESPDYPNPLFDTDNSFRQHFLNQRRQNLVNGKRVELLDQYLSNSSVFVDGMAHHIIDDKHMQWKEINEIENAYKNLIQMKGTTYTFKRGTYWRTWRKVRYPDGKDNIICYRCANSINSTSCQYGGYWIIEENPPPCSYEIFSVINDRDLCAGSLFNYTNINKKCPIVEQFGHITTFCDNPIKTQFSITKEYGNVSEQNAFPAVICNGRDYCEISTSYMISRDHISFRIINITNHVIYSRVMKNGGKNYACVNCGQIDIKTNSIIKSDTPISLDLLNKKKRNFQELDDLSENVLNITDFKENLDALEGNFYYFESKKMPKKHKHSVTCQSLKHFNKNDDEDDDLSDD